MHRPTTQPATITARSPCASRPRISPLAVCREALATFGTQCGPILVCAVLGFAVFDAIIQSFGLLQTSGLLFSEKSGPHPWLLFLWAIVGLPMYTLAQGAIAWIGLEGTDVSGMRSLNRAVSAALSRWPALLLGSSLRTTLTLAGMLGIIVILRSQGWDMTSAQPPSIDPSRMLRVIAVRSIDAVFTSMTPPSFDLIAGVRDHLLTSAPPPGPLGPAGGSVNWRLYHLTARDNSDIPQLLVALASLVVLFTSETLLRFCVVTAMHISRPLKLAHYDLCGPLIESARLGWRYFGPVSLQVWLSRLTVAGIQVTFLILPLVVANNVVLPQVSRSAGIAWLGLACRLLCIVGSAAVSAILAAFCTLCDARLCVALQRAEQDR